MLSHHKGQPPGSPEPTEPSRPPTQARLKFSEKLGWCAGTLRSTSPTHGKCHRSLPRPACSRPLKNRQLRRSGPRLESGPGHLSATAIFPIRRRPSVLRLGCCDGPSKAVLHTYRFLITEFIKEVSPLLPNPCHLQNYDLLPRNINRVTS